MYKIWFLFPQYFLEKAKSLKTIHFYNEHAQSGICTFNVFDKGQMIPAQDVASFLNTKGIAVRSGTHCAKMLVDVLQVPGTCRASFYIYNTKFILIRLCCYIIIFIYIKQFISVLSPNLMIFSFCGNINKKSKAWKQEGLFSFSLIIVKSNQRIKSNYSSW